MRKLTVDEKFALCKVIWPYDYIKGHRAELPSQDDLNTLERLGLTIHCHMCDTYQPHQVNIVDAIMVPSKEDNADDET